MVECSSSLANILILGLYNSEDKRLNLLSPQVTSLTLFINFICLLLKRNLADFSDNLDHNLFGGNNSVFIEHLYRMWFSEIEFQNQNQLLWSNSCIECPRLFASLVTRTKCLIPDLRLLKANFTCFTFCCHHLLS